MTSKEPAELGLAFEREDGLGKVALPKDDGVIVGGPVVSAVIVPCASRKSVPASDNSRAFSLPLSKQSDLETAWMERLATLKSAGPAISLYRGRGFGLAVKTAETVQAPLFILSAGLGLIAATKVIPSYGMTVAGRGDDSVVPRVAGRFDGQSWWKAVCGSRFSSSFSALLPGSGLILAALSQPYARMIASDLDSLSDADLSRLRVCGLSVSASLPHRVRDSVLPYDERLHAILPGTRADFAQRALFHFSSTILVSHSAASLDGHRRCVENALRGKSCARLAERIRLSDEGIIEAISQRLAAGSWGIQRTLRAMRDEDGVSCEQARFSRLYKHVESRRLSS